MKNQFRKSFFLLYTLSTTSILSGAFAATPVQKSGVQAAKPSLVVVIFVDQMRAEYLNRFDSLFGDNGFRMLKKQGAWLTNANYESVPTFTAVGHASTLTGSIPAMHGIVGNSFFDRNTNQVVASVFDGNAKLISTPRAEKPQDPLSNVKEDTASPRNLKAYTLGDQMRLASSGRSKVISISLKDRSAVLMGGQRPNGAFWFNEKRGEFVTSSYYMQQLPEWVNSYNKSGKIDILLSQIWNPLFAAAKYTGTFENPENTASPIGNQFPHTLVSKDRIESLVKFESTPFAADYLADFALEALKSEKLGQQKETDLLALSFSSPDILGHAFGPDSKEMADTYARLDRTIERFLTNTLKTVGSDNVAIVLVADHGVAPVPEIAIKQGYSAGRISTKDLKSKVEAALTEAYGKGDWIVSLNNDQIYLNYTAISEKKLELSKVQDTAAKAALYVEGIAQVFTGHQLQESAVPPTPMAKKVMLGFDAKRSGDVVLMPQPFWFLGGFNSGTTHGTGYSYDTHVPIIMFGKAFKPGIYQMAVSPSDIAPTLSQVLQITPPSNTTGRVITEVIK